MLATFPWAYWLIRQHWLLSKNLDSGKSSSFFTIRYLILKLLLYAIKPNIYLCLCVCVYMLLSCVQLFATPWTVAFQAPLSMEYCSGQEYWSGLPFPTPEDLPNPRIKPASLVSPAFAGGFFTAMPLGNPIYIPALNEKALWSYGVKMAVTLAIWYHQ